MYIYVYIYVYHTMRKLKIKNAKENQESKSQGGTFSAIWVDTTNNKWTVADTKYYYRALWLTSVWVLVTEVCREDLTDKRISVLSYFCSGKKVIIGYGERAGSAIASLFCPPGVAFILPSHNKIHDTDTWKFE